MSASQGEAPGKNTLLAYQTVQTEFLLLKPPRSVVFCQVTPSKLIPPADIPAPDCPSP